MRRRLLFFKGEESLKLVYKDQIIKESDSLEELEQERKMFIRAELHKKDEFQKRWLELYEAKKYVLPRNYDDSVEDYLEKVKLVNNDFITKFENLVSDMGFKIIWVKYKNIPQGFINFKVETSTDLPVDKVGASEILSFTLLGGIITVMAPMLEDVQIIE